MVQEYASDFALKQFQREEMQGQEDILFTRFARFYFFEPKVGRYTYDPVHQSEFKEFLTKNPIESFLDLEDPDNSGIQLFQIQRAGGQPYAHCIYQPVYIEIDSRAVPYRYLSEIRSKGATYDLIKELLNEVRKTGRYFRRIEKKVVKGFEGLQIETCVNKAYRIEEDPIGIGFGESSNTFRNCR